MVLMKQHCKLLTGVDVSGDGDSGFRFVPAWTPGIGDANEARDGSKCRKGLHVDEDACRTSDNSE